MQVVLIEFLATRRIQKTFTKKIMLVFLRIVKFYPSGPNRSAEKIPCVKRH